MRIPTHRHGDLLKTRSALRAAAVLTMLAASGCAAGEAPLDEAVEGLGCAAREAPARGEQTETSR